MTEQTNSGIKKDVGNEDLKTQDHSFLECLANAEALIDKCPMRSPGELGERMIHLTSGVVLFAIVLVETADSLIVSHPTVLVSNNGRVTGRLMMDTLQSRLFKSCIVTLSKPSELHKYYYLKFLMEDLAELPAVLTDKRLSKSFKFLADYKEKAGESEPVEVVPEEGEFEGERDPVYDEVPSRKFALYKKRTIH